ncbi:MAG: FAD-dependent oxidoreductase [Clostridia bacterium]|nr:FAD-dependent oxidoreductase [Clostridia bacterium]
MGSPWNETVKFEEREALRKDCRTDVLIIGGGIAGILCADRLRRAGVDCMLVEADRICAGVTGNTTAKITSQHGLLYADLEARFGTERARMYLEANEGAVGAYRTLCKDLDCDFEEQDAYVYSRRGKKRLEREMRALERIGYRAEWTDHVGLPFAVSGAIRFSHQAQFHPLKFLHALSQGLHIYEHTRVRELVGLEAVCNHARIRAERIIVATHFPFLNKHGGYFLKLYQSRSYVCAYESDAEIGGMYIDEDPQGLSFRRAGELLMIGGGAHRTGKRGRAWQDCEALARAYYPDAALRYRFAAQDCMTLDGMPYVGAYGGNTKGLYVATGFGKWGMTSAMIAAELLADMVAGRKNPYEALLSPSRSMLHPQLVVNGAEALCNLLTPFGRRCPHMGCALKWNPHEHSWDCPCHGSRFDADGHLLDNPATGDLKK